MRTTDTGAETGGRLDVLLEPGLDESDLLGIVDDGTAKGGGVDGSFAESDGSGLLLALAQPGPLGQGGDGERGTYISEIGLSSIVGAGWAPREVYSVCVCICEVCPGV